MAMRALASAFALVLAGLPGPQASAQNAETDTIHLVKLDKTHLVSITVFNGIEAEAIILGTGASRVLTCASSVSARVR